MLHSTGQFFSGVAAIAEQEKAITMTAEEINIFMLLSFLWLEIQMEKNNPQLQSNWVW